MSEVREDRSVVEVPADRSLLQKLLQTYNEHPEQRAEAAAEIDRRFRRRVAIMVLDTSGFSRAVRAVGIVHFLALLERMERLVTPLVEKAGGRVLRREADDLYAIFDEPGSAVGCATEILRELNAVNEVLPEDEEIYLTMGIGYGDVLLVGTDDLFGDEMNLASKLGEDLAQRGEVLLTPGAYEALGPKHDWQFEDVTFSVSGLRVVGHRLVAEESRG
jgi:adenylate cyclase